MVGQLVAEFSDDRKIKHLIEEVVEDQISVSVSATGENSGTYNILLKPAPKADIIRSVCRVLDNNGYETKVKNGLIPSRWARLGKMPGYTTYIHKGYNQSIIVARVSAPKPPENSPQLPRPGGRKPKK